MSRRKKPNFNLTFKDYGKNETLCLLSLSDAWSRRAEFDRPELASEFNQIARDMCAAAKNLDCDSGESRPGEKLQAAFDRIVSLANQEGIDRIILPVSSGSEMGRFIKKNLLKHYEGDVKVDLQSSSYTSRLQHLGKIDRRRKTAFEYGLAKVSK